MKWLGIWFCLMFAINGTAQLAEFPKGKLLDSIPVQNSESESYALYVPKSADLELQSSIVFIFDPGGRGKNGIRPFLQAAEKYDLILVCSNNSRNTAYSENYNIADRMFKDVFSRFKIDQKGLYGAGFSGGSRLVSSIGVLSGAFKAVLGCGAAFSASTGDMPVADDHFYYAGLVGYQDMNYQEMLKAGHWLDQIGLKNKIFTFDGRHSWPEEEQITKAFDWFYLQDIDSGSAPMNKEFLEEYLSQLLNDAQRLREEDQIVDLVRQYDHIKSSLGKYYDLDSIEVKSKKLKKSKEYKRSLQEKSKIAEQESAWTSKLLERIDKESQAGQSADNFKWWRKELDRLDEDYTKSTSIGHQRMGERLQYMIFAVGIESFDWALAQNDERKADYYAQFLTANWPNYAYVHIKVANGYGQMERTDEALEHLEKALDLGWKNKSYILSTKGFDKLRNDEKFRLLMDQLQ